MKTKNKKMNEKECKDWKCPSHGEISLRGRKFKGYITKIVGRRAVIEWERTVYYAKFERFAKTMSKIHAYIPECMADSIKVGDYVTVTECRPISKILHFIVTGKVEK